MTVEYGVCVGSWDKYDKYVAPCTGGKTVHTRHGQTSIAAAYNSILDTIPPDTALILLHDDLELADPDGEAKLLAALAPDVGLVGVAGGSGKHGLAWWLYDPVGHQQTDVLNIDFGPRTGDVDLLEGSLLVFSPWAVKILRFDERFPGFHGYDEIAAQAGAAGMRVVVADVDTHHHSALGFKTEASHLQWLEADRLYREKWGLG